MRTSPAPTLSFDEYVSHDATALAELVRAGAVTPAELLETAIARAEAVIPQLNAIVTPLYEKGRAMAAHLHESGAFRGVPMLIKDMELEWAGTPMKSGCRGSQNYVSTADSEIIPTRTPVFGRGGS